jgi:type IV pilus assembly protein PilF
MKTVGLIHAVFIGFLLTACGSHSNKDDYQPTQQSVYYTAMGKEYLRRGQHAVAMERLLKAIELDEKNAEAQNTLAILYERLDKKEQAENHYLQALALSPDASEIHNDYGRFLCRYGRIEEAEKHFQQALTNPLYEKPPLVWANAGLCANQMKQYDKAKSYFSKVLDSEIISEDEVLQRALGVSLYQMAEIHQKQGDYAQAEKHLQRYEKHFAHNAQTLWLGVQIERSLKKPVSESDYALRLKSEFPHSPQAEKLP